MTDEQGWNDADEHHDALQRGGTSRTAEPEPTGPERMNEQTEFNLAVLVEQYADASKDDPSIASILGLSARRVAGIRRRHDIRARLPPSPRRCRARRGRAAVCL